MADFRKMNELGKRGVPFLFIIDFDMKGLYVSAIDKVENNTVLFDIEGFRNFSDTISVKPAAIEVVDVVARERYMQAFDFVQQHIKAGNTYLLNLTFPTEVTCNLGLKDIFFAARSKYKFWYQNSFVCFSPETFVRIQDNRIFSYPMKGTIDASIPNAREIIMSDPKETAEHYTIVDLIRNDLSIVSEKVTVEKFRYIDEIKTSNKTLLQVSSAISGKLPSNYREHIGDILQAMLPAGSVTGAPKKKTVEIIKEAEQYDRGFYTGVFGYFDGSSLNSAVMIRFIEKQGDKLFYKSGGGITFDSKSDDEYRELKEKIYIPV